MKALRNVGSVGSLLAGALIAAQATGCADDPSSVVLTINARPAVIYVDQLKIRIAIDGVGQDKIFDISNKTFPQTLSISTTSLASGTLSITAEATGQGTLIGFGKVDTSFTNLDAQLMLEAADFVVNDTVLDDQELVQDFEAAGYQIASFPNGDFDIGFRSPSNRDFVQQGRRFTITSDTVVTTATTDDTPWNFSTDPTLSLSAIAIANNTRRTLAAWDLTTGVLSTSGIMCRSISANGALSAAPVLVAVDGQPDVVTVAALPNGNFVLAWRGSGPVVGGTIAIRAKIVDENCADLAVPPPPPTPPSPSFQVSTISVPGMSRPSVAARSGGIMFGWIAGDDVRVRRFSITGASASLDEMLVAKTSDIVSNNFVRLAPYGAGFAAVYHQTLLGSPKSTRIMLQRLSIGGMKDPATVVITPDTRALDLESFGVYSSGDMDPLMVTWRGCPDQTDFDCGEIFGRLIRPNGQPMGEAFTVNTTTTGQQDTPSVTRLGPSGDAPIYAFAWNDNSHVEPDTSGSAVRSRVMYPTYNLAASTLGADCRTGKPACADGLVCIGDTENVPRCVLMCNPTGPAPLCPLGGACTKQGDVSGCRF